MYYMCLYIQFLYSVQIESLNLKDFLSASSNQHFMDAKLVAVQTTCLPHVCLMSFNIQYISTGSQLCVPFPACPLPPPSPT